MARTEEDKVTHAPLNVKFGDTDYEIKPLGILQQRKWRKKTQEELGPLVNGLQVSTVNNRTVVAGLPAALAEFPEKMCDLVFSYAPNLPKEKILEEATEEQMTVAFGCIWELVFQAFLVQLGSATELLKPSPAPALANSLN